VETRLNKDRWPGGTAAGAADDDDALVVVSSSSPGNAAMMSGRSSYKSKVVLCGFGSFFMYVLEDNPIMIP